MAQIKIYGLKDQINPRKARLSDVIHACVVEALKFPVDKRAHRFFPLEHEDFYYPAGRSENYTIIEINMIEGRTVETKKHLIRLLFERINQELGISVMDIEINIFESPKHNWGFRGKTGDEVDLTYKIEV
jgi:phenylpyruvate tautomerase PptA (4-oxalocrotonate tautomerase family)